MDRGTDKYIGKLLDNRYEILELVGVGGMAYVYKGLCHRLNRIVAVKILKDEYVSDEDFRRRFHAESQAVAQLSHPNIVSAYDVSKSEEVEYIVMEYIDGMTLKQYMQRKGVLPWREALHYVTQITKALNHAHSRGVIHRDIKPHNIMLLRDGSVKVADFGIARFATMQNTLTKEALGSVHYISPEQARGSQIDVRSDIYSTGVVLYEMLTGRLPYEGDSPVSVAIQHINSMPLTPRDINPDIPAALEAITMKAMAPNINNRYTDTDEMLHDLEEFRKNPAIVFEYQTGKAAQQNDEPTVVMKPVNIISPEEAEAQKIPEPEPESKPLMVNVAQEASIQDRLQNRAAAKKTDNASGKKKRTKKDDYTFLIGAMGVLLLVGLLVFLGVMMWNSMGGNGDETETMLHVDLLVGRTIDNVEADEELNANFVIEQEWAYSNSVDKNYIVSQTPESDTKAAKGSTIKIVVSLGVAPMELRDFKGADPAEAINEIRALGLSYEQIEDYDDNVEKGKVIATDPAAGTPVTELAGVKVTIKVSKGIKPIEMPNLMGLTKAQAEKIIQECGLIVGDPVYQPGSAADKVGTVIGQSPTFGTQIDLNIAGDADKTVTLVIADPAEVTEMVSVPDLYKKNIDDINADDDLKADFNIVVSTAREYSDSIAADCVVKQSPKAGTSAQKGSTITVTLSKGAEAKTMPRLTAVSVDNAIESLEELGLSVSSTREEVYSDTVAAGSVVGTVPAAGEPVPSDGVVKLIVSLGKKPEETTAPPTEPPTESPTVPPTPTAVVPTPSPYNDIPVRLPTDRQGIVRVRIYQNDQLIYDKEHNIAEGVIYFSTTGFPDDTIMVMFDEEVRYTNPLGALKI